MNLIHHGESDMPIRHQWHPIFRTVTVVLAAWIFLDLSSAAETTSPPVGEYHVTVPVGTSAWVYGMVTEEKWRGQLEEVWINGSFIPNQVGCILVVNGQLMADHAFAQGRHYVEVMDGAWQGLVLDIYDNYDRGFTIYGDAAPGGFDLQPGTTLAVRAHATLGTMFPGASSGFLAGSDLIMAACNVDDGYGGVMQMERVFVHNGWNWEDGGSLEPADDVVVYPGQGFLVTIGGSPGDPPRNVAFGTGPVCHVKTTQTLIPLDVCYTAIQLMGPVWPVEVDSGGAFRTVGVLDLGLFQVTEPFSDIFVTFSSNGLMQDLAIYGSDGVELINALTRASGSVTAADRFVKGSALYFAALSQRYWITEGVE